MPSPDINAPSPSTSSVSVEDLNVQHIENLLNTDKYTMNSSMENITNEIDVYVPTTIVNNAKSFITPESFSTIDNSVQGMILFFRLIIYYYRF